MIDIIIALILALGINIDKEYVNVVEDRTGMVFGVGTNSTVNNSEIDPKTFVLYQDEAGNYYLLEK